MKSKHAESTFCTFVADVCMCLILHGCIMDERSETSQRVWFIKHPHPLETEPSVMMHGLSSHRDKHQSRDCTTKNISVLQRSALDIAMTTWVIQSHMRQPRLWISFNQTSSLFLFPSEGQLTPESKI